jgi:hypothetical protein
MKSTHWLLIALLTGGAAIAEEAKPNAERPKRPDRPIPAEILKEFDKDGDGKLSADEHTAMRTAMRERRMARHQEMLKRFDADGDGKLNEEERKTAHDAILKEMLVKYDTNGNGELDPDERRTMIQGEGHNPLAPFMRPRGPREPRVEGENRRGPRGEGADRPRRGTDAQRDAYHRAKGRKPSE